MQRYLLRFAYDGSHFSGSQIQTKRVPPPLWTETYVATNRNSVQGAIELGLIQLRPANEPRLQLSSRTDKGVHALSSTATVDLQQRYNVKTTYFPPKYITTRLNTYFDLAKIDIRISKTLAVKGEFSVRRAVNRTYLYRFAVRKTEDSFNFPTNYAHNWEGFDKRSFRKWDRDKNAGRMQITGILPYPDMKYIAEVRRPICMDKTREVLKMFEGTHNFASLAMTKSSRTKKWRDPDTHLYTDTDREPDYFIRTIDKIEVEKVPPPLSPNSFSCYDAFDFYTAKFTAQSYFQNQIRRFMGLAFGVGVGSIDIQTIADMLKNPVLPENKPNNSIKGTNRMADPRGLHLLDVNYSLEDLEDSSEEVNNCPIGSPTEYPSPMIDWSNMNNCLTVTRPRYLLETSHRGKELTTGTFQ